LIDDFIRPFLAAARKMDHETLIGPDHASDALIERMATFEHDATTDPDLPADTDTLMRDHVAPMVREMIRNATEKKILRTGFAPVRARTHVLQSLILPDPAVPDAPGLCIRPLPDQETPQAEPGALRFADGAGAGFDTWFNLFDATAWARLTDINHLQLTLSGEGRFQVALFVDTEETGTLCASRQEVTLDDGPVHVPVIALGKSPRCVWFTLTALSPAALQDAQWCTADSPKRAVDMALCITTFRREVQAEATIARMRARFGRDAAMRLIVVDNGQTLPCRDEQDGRLQVLHNPNLGGSGGFARGLIEARAAGATHCLFMDDDVTLHPEAILRARALLRFATDPATAVSGAMIDAARPWFLWENGATYRLFCRPIEMGRDLRDPDEARALARLSAEPVPEGFYGGWWFFAFPLDHVDHLPFPFFVRGDDVSFSLANRFAPTTLPGIASFQENFTDNESPLTWYLDLRSHLAHQLTLRGAGRAACLKIIGWFAVRCLVRMHYDSLAALSLAVEDVLDGPDHFARQGDLAARRAQIAALTEHETWKPTPTPPTPRRIRLSPHLWPVRLLMKLTLNGHLLPGFSHIGNHIILPANQRGWLRTVWGASRLTQLSRDRSRCYQLHHSKALAWSRMARLAGRTLRLWRRHGALRRDWQNSYARLTTEKAWRDLLELGASASAPITPSGPKD
jgi:GT2 family glycosyltransferase